MRQFLLAVCVMSIAYSPALSQDVPKDAQPKAMPSPAQTKPVQQAALPGNATADTKTSGSKPAAANASEDFIIGPEDVLEIKVWREPDLATRAVVRPDGKIGVTLLNDVQASGLTTTQLKESIAAKLDRFVEQPEVSVVVVEIRSQTVHLIGAVSRPGAYALGGPLTVVELLARAGGVSELAKADQIAIIRQRGKGELERILFNYKEFMLGKNLHSNIQLRNGDVVMVR
jgi:polysaccharide export outer membrane protein